MYGFCSGDERTIQIQPLLNQKCFRPCLIFVSDNAGDGRDRAALYDQYIVLGTDLEHGSGYRCLYCDVFIRGNRSNARNHVEARHFNTEYTCRFCGKKLKTKNTLSKHISVQHRNERRIEKKLGHQHNPDL